MNINALFFRFYLQKEYHVSGFHVSKWLLWKRVLMHDRGGKLAARSLDKGEIATRSPIVYGANRERTGSYTALQV